MSPTPSQLWSRLRAVRTLRFESTGDPATGWTGVGTGTVAVTAPSKTVLLFTEAGTFQQPQGKPIEFTNVFRWTKLGRSIRLEHLRFGPDHPVFLFDMQPTAGMWWEQVTPHQCVDDCYAATLLVDDDKLILTWTVTGPGKRESIRYTYSPRPL